MSDILTPTIDSAPLPGAERHAPYQVERQVMGFDIVTELELPAEPFDGRVENPGRDGAYPSYAPDGFSGSLDMSTIRQFPESLPTSAFEVHDTADAVARQVLGVAYDSRGRLRVVGGMLEDAGVRKPARDAVEVVLGLEDGSTVTLSSSAFSDGRRTTQLRVATVTRGAEGTATEEVCDVAWGSEAPDTSRRYPQYARRVEMAVSHQAAGVEATSAVEKFSAASATLQRALDALMQTRSSAVTVSASGLY